MTLTRIVLAFVVLLLIAFDIYTAIFHGMDSTISWQTYSMSKDTPIIPFGIGVVCGHLFWVQKGA